MTTNTSSGLMESIRQDEFVLMDGALGTELERRGVPIEGAGWSAFAVRDYADVIVLHSHATCWNRLASGISLST
jgi:S-methylmethionine-dependent homocysteine/selenocysteine methylase